MKSYPTMDDVGVSKYERKESVQWTKMALPKTAKKKLTKMVFGAT